MKPYAGEIDAWESASSVMMAARQLGSEPRLALSF
jgi:hypothetical protein